MHCMHRYVTSRPLQCIDSEGHLCGAAARWNHMWMHPFTEPVVHQCYSFTRLLPVLTLPAAIWQVRLQITVSTFFGGEQFELL